MSMRSRPRCTFGKQSESSDAYPTSAAPSVLLTDQKAKIGESALQELHDPIRKANRLV